MTKAKIHFITGGQRSGKSEYAEKLALGLLDSPIYLATSKVWDEEYKKRIDVHQKRRTNNWITVEEEINIDKYNFKNKVVLLDCITLWITNVFEQEKYDVDNTIAFVKQKWNKLCEQEITLIVVSNEIGMGLIPIQKGSRSFIDIQGKINQYIAKQARNVTFMISGIPLEIKGKEV